MAPQPTVQTWKGPVGEVRLSFPSPRLNLHRVVGRYDVPAVRFVFDSMAAHFAAHGENLMVFGDLDLTSYDQAIRHESNRFLRDHGRRIAGLYLLVRHPLALAAFSVLKLIAAFPMEVYASRDSYERALLAALQRESPGAEALHMSAIGP
jgi:hypothetical protein